MIRPNHHSMERGTKPQGVLREDQPVVAFGVFIDFSGFCPVSVPVFRNGFFMPARTSF
ncbi:hypothetical protein [Hymenobacter sp. PAMC 26628]|uniref:hypothetical protein n=1 Tax=Hymenobacter sp. PAMC 26628 TaxID=1484118 RepID=UPI0012FF686F|nr:hypothetical protein [Hymenobacter sp. PAMC 26628]